MFSDTPGLRGKYLLQIYTVPQKPKKTGTAVLHIKYDQQWQIEYPFGNKQVEQRVTPKPYTRGNST